MSIELLYNTSTFCLLSVVILVTNKAVALACSQIDAIVLVQNSVSVLLCVISDRRNGNSKYETLWPNIRGWMPCGIVYWLATFSSLRALQIVSIRAFFVLGVLDCILALGLEYVMNKKCPGFNLILSILLSLAGAIIYVLNDLEYDIQGYTWCLIHIASMAIYEKLAKFSDETLQLPAPDMFFYNNLISLIFSFLMLLTSSAPRVSIHHLEPCISASTASVLWFSGMLSFVVCLSTSWAEQTLSFSTFLALQHGARIPALLVSSRLYQERASWPMLAGLALSLLGEYLYAMAVRGAGAQPGEPGITRGRGLREMFALLVLLLAASASAMYSSHEWVFRSRVRTARLSALAAAHDNTTAQSLADWNATPIQRPTPPPYQPALFLKYDRRLCTGIGDRMSVFLSVAAMARAVNASCYVYW